MRYSHFLSVILSVSLLMMLGCGGNSAAPSVPAPTAASPAPAAPGGTPAPPPSPTTPGGGTPSPAPAPAPTPSPATSPSAIASTSPKDGATCISQNPLLEVHFTAGAASSNVTADNFKVTGPFGAEDGEVNWDAASNTATWRTRPVNARESSGPNLGMASNFTATISGFSGGPYSFAFQTGPCGPPAVYPASAQLFDIPNSTLTFVLGINNHGTITGGYGLPGGGESGFIFQDGHVTVLKGRGYKINDSNAVTGEYAPLGMSRGYLYQNGEYTDIVDPAATAPEDQNWAYSINNAGVLIGGYVANHTGTFATGVGFIRQPNGSYSDFRSRPRDINNSGHILGQGSNGSWLYDGSFHDVLANCSTVLAEGLNDNDDVAGYAASCPDWSPETTRGFVKRGDAVYQVVIPGCRYLMVNDINNDGVVVGFCNDNEGDHGFIATPK